MDEWPGLSKVANKSIGAVRPSEIPAQLDSEETKLMSLTTESHEAC